MPPEPPPRSGPTRLPRVRRAGRGRVVLVAVAVAAFVLLVSLRGIAGFYTDYLWYDSLGQGGVFAGVLQARLTLVVLFTVGFFVLLFANLVIADRLAPAFPAPGPEEEIVARYRELVGDRTGLVRLVVAAFFALVAGVSPASQWNEWILFNNATQFGTTDPLFDRDIGFYVFRLPFLDYLVGWLFAALVIVFLLTTVWHYLNGGIRLQAATQRVTPQVKVQLSVLLALIAFVKAGGYYLQQYGLVVSTRGTVDGATYTDVNAQLPAIRLLILVAIAAAALFLVNVRRKGWVLPILGVGIWGVVAVVGGAIVPALVQGIRVRPSEGTLERPFIERNIAATREAFGLDEVVDQTFDPAFDLDDASLQGDNAAVVKNIRLWDPNPDATQRTFAAQEAVRTFYRVNDVDIDRYEIDGELVQVAVAARDLNTSGVQQSSWEATHLAFTHGYGAIMAPTNVKTTDGAPEYVLSDIPVQEQAGLEIERPQIYFGERLGSFVVVGTDRDEIDYTLDDNTTQSHRYQGADGIDIGNPLRRAAFALRFADVNLLVSGTINSDSRILFRRDVEERVSSLAPFLALDQDPYLVVVDGRLQWVVDAYTTTSRYPYSQRADVEGLGADLDVRFNYIRNSVKAVVDAYDGTVRFYIVDPDDPIAAAYRQAFPDLFEDGQPPEAIQAHYRYPEDIFRVQTNIWGRYHVEDPSVFYTEEQSWVVPRQPSPPDQRASTAAVTSTTEGDAPQRSRDRVEPFYALTRLPGQDELGFQIIRPYAPFSADDSRQQLTSYLVAESDDDGYGRLTSYRVIGPLPNGPGLAADNINADVEVSREQSLLCQQGSECVFGNILLVPIEDSFIYVQPLYVRSSRANSPALLQRIIVEYDGQVAIASSLADALLQLDAFTEVPTVQDRTDVDAPPTEPGDPTSGTTSTTEDDGGSPTTSDVEIDPDATPGELLARAEQLFADADEALADGDLGGYQSAVDEARALIDRASELLDLDDASTTATTAEPA